MNSETYYQQLMIALDEMKSRVKGNPRCSVRDCHGRGYIGYSISTDKQDGRIRVDLQLCICGKETMTEYERLRLMIEQLKEMQAASMGIQREIYRHTFYGGLKVGWERFRNRFKRKTPRGPAA